MIHVLIVVFHGDFCLFKYGWNDLWLHFKVASFVKHIFNFSRTTGQIWMKLGSSMHLSMVSYVDKHIGSYVKCIFTS